MNTVILMFVFVALVTFLVAVRLRTGNKFEIKTADIVLPLVLIGLWMFLTGRISKFQAAGVTIERAFAQATEKPVDTQVTAVAHLPVEDIEPEAKGSVGQIQRLIDQKSQALSFRIGYGGYRGPDIAEYFQTLLAYPYLRYVVIEYADGRVFGLAEASEVWRWLSDEVDPADLADWLIQSDTLALARVPGLVPAAAAIDWDTDKTAALEAMEARDVNTLPVVDAERRFVGVVDRSRLTASILIDVARGLEE